MLPRSIGENVARFKETRDIRYLLNAGRLTAQQGRVTELLYGAYCYLLRSPSRPAELLDERLRPMINDFRRFDSSRQGLSRDALIEQFGDEYAMSSLPRDFGGARVATVLQEREQIVVGEYSARWSARLAVVGRHRCSVNDYYSRLQGVWHIHLVHKHELPGKILVATGDSRKVLDVWTLEDGRIRFVERMRKRLAGHSAAAMVRDKVYLGTDFSGRPNYIETLDGKKYFFPRKSYDKYTVSFTSVMNRYIFCVNAALKPMGGREALSIFDAANERFVFCEYLDVLADPMP